MFQYEITVTGNIDSKKLWEFYSDVSRWREWDDDVENVTLDGDFIPGSQGVMTMKNGQALPFVIESVDIEKEFTTVSNLGEIKVSFIHIMTDTLMTHTVTISGGPEEQMDGMGKGITANLPGTMDKLFSMVKS